MLVMQALDKVYAEKEKSHPQYSLEVTAQHIYATLGMEMPPIVSTVDEETAQKYYAQKYGTVAPAGMVAGYGVHVNDKPNHVRSVTNTIHLNGGHIAIKRSTLDLRVEEISFTQYAIDGNHICHDQHYRDYTETLKLYPNGDGFNRYGFIVHPGSERELFPAPSSSAQVNDKEGLQEWFFDNKGTAVGSLEYVEQKIALMSGAISDDYIPGLMKSYVSIKGGLNNFAIRPLVEHVKL